MPDAPSAPNPIQNFVDAKNPVEAIRILQNSGLNKDQLYEIRRNLNLDAIAPNDFLLADNAWGAAEALKMMKPNDFRKFKALFGRRYKESTKASVSSQTVEKNLGAALGAAIGFAPKTDERKKTKEKSPEQKTEAQTQATEATQTSAEPTKVAEPEVSTQVKQPISGQRQETEDDEEEQNAKDAATSKGLADSIEKYFKENDSYFDKTDNGITQQKVTAVQRQGNRLSVSLKGADNKERKVIFDASDPAKAEKAVVALLDQNEKRLSHKASSSAEKLIGNSIEATDSEGKEVSGRVISTKYNYGDVVDDTVDVVVQKEDGATSKVTLKRNDILGALKELPDAASEQRQRIPDKQKELRAEQRQKLKDLEDETRGFIGAKGSETTEERAVRLEMLKDYRDQFKNLAAAAPDNKSLINDIGFTLNKINSAIDENTELQKKSDGVPADAGPTTSAPTQVQRTPTLKGLGQNQTELDRLEGEFKGLEQELDKLTENVGEMNQEQFNKTIETLNKADKVRRQHFEVGSKLIESLPQGGQSAEIAENILSRQDGLNNYVGTTGRQLDMSANPVLKNFDGTKYALDERDLGRIQSTIKKRFELGGIQGPMLQAAIASRLTDSARFGEANEGGVALVQQSISLAKKNLSSITEHKDIATDMIDGAETKLNTVQKNLQYRREDQAKRGLMVPESEGERRSKREGFVSQPPIKSQAPDTSAIDQGWAEQPPTQGPTNSEERREKSETGPTPPTARRMPPGTPFNIKPGSVLPIERMVNLGAQQYRARRKAGPSDQRAQVMGERGLGESTPVLLESQEPLGASAYSAGPSDEKESKDGGGAMISDLESIQHMQASQQRARRSQRLALGEETGIPGMEEEYEGLETEETPSLMTAEEIEEAEEKEEVLEPREAQGVRGDFEKLAAWTMAQQMQRKKVQNQEQRKVSMQTHVQNVQKMQKNLQMIWRVLNAAELLSSEAIYPALLWLLTANMQMINKYTFQVKWIPPTEIYEDAVYLFLDFLIIGAVLLIVVILVIIIALIAMMVSGAVSALL